MNQEIKVFVVDHYTLVWEGLHRILAEEAGIKVLKGADDGSEMMNAVLNLQPDVLILDATLPETEEFTRTVVTKEPAVKVLILATECEVQQALNLLSAGATGYLGKDATPQDLISAVYHTHRRETVLDPTIARGVVELLTGTCHQANVVLDNLCESLTEREVEVLRFLCQGDTDKDIAKKLFISTRTVNGHLTHIYAKLGVHSRTEAMHLALEKGWVTLAIGSLFILKFL